MAASFRGRLWVMGGEAIPAYRMMATGMRFGRLLTERVGNIMDERLGLRARDPLLSYSMISSGCLAATEIDCTSEVWSSRDGVNWVLESSNPGWSARAFHTAVVFDGKIWLMAGGRWGSRSDFAERCLELK